MAEIIPCPSCGHENSLLRAVCEQCGASLFGVAPRTHAPRGPAPELEPQPSPQDTGPRDEPPCGPGGPGPGGPKSGRSEAEPKPPVLPETGYLPVFTELALVHSTGARLSAPGDRFEVGRDGDLRPDFFLDFPAVSRRHLTLRRHGSGIWTATEHSRHGTRLNGESLPTGEARPLRDGDTLKLADQTFTVCIR